MNVTSRAVSKFVMWAGRGGGGEGRGMYWPLLDNLTVTSLNRSQPVGVNNYLAWMLDHQVNFFEYKVDNTSRFIYIQST